MGRVLKFSSKVSLSLMSLCVDSLNQYTLSPTTRNEKSLSKNLCDISLLRSAAKEKDGDGCSVTESGMELQGVGSYFLVMVIWILKESKAIFVNIEIKQSEDTKPCFCLFKPLLDIFKHVRGWGL